MSYESVQLQLLESGIRYYAVNYSHGLLSALGVGVRSTPLPVALPPGKGTGAHCTGG